MKCLAWAVCLLGLLLAAPSLAEAQQGPPTDPVRLEELPESVQSGDDDSL